MKKDKRSQSEIMGLAIIVILIIIGLFFYISFSIKPPNTQISNVERQTALSFVTAFFKTDTPCGQIGTEVIPECANGDNSISGCSYSSCDLLYEVAANITNMTLIEWGMHYDFKIVDGEDNVLYQNTTGCSAGDTRSRYEIQPVSLWSVGLGTGSIGLAICE